MERRYIMKTYEEMKIDIDKMSHEQMCFMWRFNPTHVLHPYFDNSNPISEYFSNRLFKHFGGFTPEISKRIGWS